MTKEEQIAAAKAAADKLRAAAPDEAAKIDKAVAELEGGKREGLSVNVTIRARLEKFDGEYEPGKQPVEVIDLEG